MIKAHIVGGAGYTAGELLRILLHHPQVSIGQITSNSQEGKLVHEIHQDLIGDTELTFQKEITTDADVIFICAGHGKARSYLEEYGHANAKIVDLSRDFRIQPEVHFKNVEFVYGLPERNKEAITQATAVANPGCFATAMQLALLPLAQANRIQSDIHISGITGSTGAGQKLQATTHFSWRSNNISTYKTFTHQHLEEVQQTLKYYQPEQDIPTHFIPYRGDFTRGILINLYTPFEGTEAEARQLYTSFYKDHPLTHVVPGALHLKQVTNTAKALISIEKHEDHILVGCAIDNLLKGASGQAVQNMNLMFGLEETTGLHLKGNYH